jgi:hypothetical protein
MQQISFINKIEENLIRHMILNSIRAYRMKFEKQYGKLVICCDGRHYWRRANFQYYKANRKKTRDESPLDWHDIFEILNKIRDEIRENFPYKVICVDEAEADDIIGVLAVRYSANEKVLILSGDKDFAQLQRFRNIFQYAPVQKKFIVEKDPIRFLNEHILKGDAGDGIPNILSADDCFVNGRQSPLRQTKIDEWLGSGVPLEELFKSNGKLLANYQRNKMLVDLDQTPLNIKERIIQEYEKPFKEDRSKLFNYFIMNKLKNLQEHITEF